jgi:predicted neuraminidase
MPMRGLKSYFYDELAKTINKCINNNGHIHAGQHANDAHDKSLNKIRLIRNEDIPLSQRR